MRAALARAGAVGAALADLAPAVDRGLPGVFRDLADRRLQLRPYSRGGKLAGKSWA
ncbi:MAG TPA: hypothetical protein VKS82_20595 [Streptosporangiaceae bacterium]|nr:hypothetical protein [Streptosporangiaceae bacterium]